MVRLAALIDRPRRGTLLTPEQVDSFRRNGYLAVRRAIDSSLLGELRAAADELLEESRTIESGDRRFELEPDHSRERPRLARANHPVVQREIFWKTASSTELVDRVSALIGDAVKFHHSKLNWKISGGGSEIGWHQDFAFFPHTNPDLVACGIALDDATTENGCLLVVPGTHAGETFSHWQTDSEFAGSITADPLPFDADSAVPVELQAGDMSMHHANVVHGSLRNDSPHSRRLLIFQYAASDAIALDYRPPANEYSGLVLRGGPVTHARLAGQQTLRLRGETGGARSIFERQRAGTAG